MDLAFERAGFETVLQCEIDKDCLRVLERHWPDVKRVNDVRSLFIERKPEDRISVVHFGSPCQDLSLAGKRAGFAGERSGLFFEAVRIVRESGAMFALWENVGGARSSADGQDFRAALSALWGSELPMPRSGIWADAGLVRGGGCSLAWRHLDAQHFGVPQRRYRVFALLDTRSDRAAEILFESEGMSRDSAEGREERQDVAASLTSGSHGSGVSAPGRHREDDTNLVYAVRTAQTGANGIGVAVAVAHTLDGGSQAIAGTLGSPQGGGFRTTDLDGVGAFVAYGNNRTSGAQSVAGAVKTSQGHQDFESETFLIAGTLAPGAHPGGYNGRDAESGLLQLMATGVRRLTPLECERLQGLPDYWTKFGSDGRELADTARYRMIGNSVAVPCVEWIARRMAAVLQTSDGGAK